MSKCPKCGKKISPLYLKEKCPNCGTHLLYYNLEENLKADAQKAQKEVDAINHFVNILRTSLLTSALTIIRFVLFFTPLGSMCLTMFKVEDKNISLLSLIMDIIHGEFNMGDISSNTPHLLGLISMILVVVLSLAEIISSLFSSTKTGLLRNIIFSLINLLVFVALGIVISTYVDCAIGIGWIVTLAIYIICDILHFICDKQIKTKKGANE